MTSSVAASPLLWSTIALAAILAAVAAVIIVQIAQGRISVAVPWGRRDVPLRERQVRIAAPRDLVRDVLTSAARGRTPSLESGERTEVVDGQDGLILNRSLTRSKFGLVQAMELVRVTEERVAYLHVAGPLPGTSEDFRLEQVNGETLLGYRGRIPVSFWALGRAVARLLIVPEYERLLDRHIAALKSTCEELAARGRQGNPDEPPSRGDDRREMGP
jgi:hypothetical protein